MGLLIIGSINVDLVARGPKLPRPGETVIGGEFFQAAGGKGANQAVAAARAGRQQVIFLAAVGNDPYGKDSLAGLRREGIDCRWIREVPGASTGVALIMVDPQGENQILVASGANLQLTAGDVDRLPDEVFSATRVFLASLEVPLAVVQRGMSCLRKAGAMTILNPAPAWPEADVKALLPLADFVTPNEHEATALAAMAVDSVESAVLAGRRLQACGAGQVIVTLGEQGCVTIDKAGSANIIRPLAVTAVDATAAGDAFSGTLAVALAEGKDLVDAGILATAAAGIAVTRIGAQPSLPTRTEIDATLQMAKIQVEPCERA